MTREGGPGRGMLAFAVGVVAAPVAGATVVILTVGLGMIWFASATDEGLAPTDEGIEFRTPDDIVATERPRRSGSNRTQAAQAEPSPSRNTKPEPRADRSTNNSPRTRIPGRQEAASEPSQERSTPASTRPDAPDAPDVARSTPDVAPPNDSDPGDDSDIGMPIATRSAPPSSSAQSPAEPGPHSFPNDGEPSWIPDTFRAVVDQGIAMLTGKAPPMAPEVAPATPSATRPSSSTTPTEATTEAAPEVPPHTRTSSDGVARVDSAPSSGGTPPDDPAPRPEPDTTDAPTPSALPTAPTGEEVAFTPAAVEPAPKRDRYARGGETLDDIVAGGIGMMTGKGAPEDAAPAYTTRAPTEMEEAVDDYTDPSSGKQAYLELNEDDFAVNVEEHDAASAFADVGEEEWQGPISLDEIIIPVSIRTGMPGVLVTVNGEPAGMTPTTVDLKDGTHRVVLGVDASASTFDVQPMSNPDAWCFAEKSSGGFRQVPCD